MVVVLPTVQIPLNIHINRFSKLLRSNFLLISHFNKPHGVSVFQIKRVWDRRATSEIPSLHIFATSELDCKITTQRLRSLNQDGTVYYFTPQ